MPKKLSEPSRIERLLVIKEALEAWLITEQDKPRNRNEKKIKAAQTTLAETETEILIERRTVKMSKQKRYYVVPCDNDGTLTDSDGKSPPRDRTWDVIDRTTGACVYGNSYTRAEARAEAARLNSSSPDDSNGGIGVFAK